MPDWLLILVGSLAGSVVSGSLGVWVGVQVLKVQMADVRTAVNRAHERIDMILAGRQ